MIAEVLAPSEAVVGCREARKAAPWVGWASSEVVTFSSDMVRRGRSMMLWVELVKKQRREGLSS